MTGARRGRGARGVAPWGLVAALCVATSACTGTSLLVVVDGDVALGPDVDGLVIGVWSGGSRLKATTFDLSRAASLPQSLEIVASDSTPSSVEVRVAVKVGVKDAVGVKVGVSVYVGVKVWVMVGSCATVGMMISCFWQPKRATLSSRMRSNKVERFTRLRLQDQRAARPDQWSSLVCSVAQATPRHNRKYMLECAP